MPSALNTALKSYKRPEPKHRREMVRIIVKAAMKKCSRPLKKHLDIIARKIVKDHPCFKDVIDGRVIGTGHESLLNQLVSRVENSVRPEKPSGSQREEKRKKRQYGCLSPCGPDEADDILKEKQAKLKELYQHGENQKYDILDLMESTYSLQRANIDSGVMNVEDLKEAWPFLFQPFGLFQHFRRLVSVDIESALNDSLPSKAQKIMEFMQYKKLEKKKLLTVLQERAGHPESPQADMMCAILLLVTYFGEKLELLLLHSEKDKAATEVTQGATPISPCIIAHGDSIYITKSYSLSIDETIVMEDLHLFERSLASLFSAYYVFNVAYPEEICATLEFIQRCFVGVNPDRGNRREKKRKTCVHKKVLRLIADMAEFEWSCK
ncbi:uncharacterized protein LOC115326229 [Ixodes scapularis]|uniref:uncharacterized protein LOC115326229 n=1 Tax=Ixodes scapularis TaxID=6945 RepID=UPI001A9F7B46|nr:uncharacterized protein LOC115326229 [Ixodes scapularis]